MSDITAETAAHPLDRLADKINGLVPPPQAAGLVRSPAVEAALKRSARRAAEIARKTRNVAPLPVRIVESFVAACAFVPYAAVALFVRLVIARIFFVSGQTMIEGPRWFVSIPDSLAALGLRFDYTVILPAAVKAQTFSAFAGPFSTVPFPPTLGAYLVSYAQFVLPVCLVLGLATRASAIVLLIITMTIQLFVYPDALWTTHIYWVALLMMLISMGPGVISLDHVIRWGARR
jgi:putative oxidoreductase